MRMPKVNGTSMTILLLLTVSLSAQSASSGESLSEVVDRLNGARLYLEAMERIESELLTDSKSPVALRLLGEATENGQGVEKDLVTAVSLYRRAANLGDSRARYLLGYAYESGKGIAQSTGSALTQYEIAAKDDPLAALRYAEIILANRGKTEFVPKHDPIDLLQKSAEMGVDRAKFLLGSMLARGDLIEQDTDRALALLNEASATVPEALSAIGTMYHQGREHEKAAPFFVKARQQGDKTGSAYLGYYAEHGLNREIDRKYALAMYQEAKNLDWAKEGAERILENQLSLDIFGLKTYGATRNEVLALFEREGARKLKSEPHYDAYDVNGMVGGRPSILTIGYAPGAPEYAAEFSYAFQIRDGKASSMLDELEAALTKQYGKWEEKKRSGGNTRMWWTVRKVRITVRYPRNAQAVRVTYQVSPYVQKLAEYTNSIKVNTKRGLADAL